VHDRLFGERVTVGDSSLLSCVDGEEQVAGDRGVSCASAKASLI
jgi:hypothetical protein